MASDMKVEMFPWSYPYCTDWHSVIFAECLWRSSSECEHSKVVGDTFGSNGSNISDTTVNTKRTPQSDYLCKSSQWMSEKKTSFCENDF